jgi:HD-GYP domain-containing protein (c-di-GMP phosphodiesterase class II)
MSTSQQPLNAPTWEENLFLALHRMIQAVRLHKDNNELVQVSLKRFKEALSAREFEDDLAVLIYNGRFFIEGEKIKFRKELVKLIQALQDFFQRRGLRGLNFSPSAGNASETEILAFVRWLVRSGEQDEPYAWLKEKLDTTDLSWVSIVQGMKSQDIPPQYDLRERGRLVYIHALTSVKQMAEKISTQGYAGVRKAKRMVQGMVDIVTKDDAVLLGLSSIKDYDDYTYTHSVNVAVLALCLGKRIGLSRVPLEHLGICGLLHDLGKVEVPLEVLTKAGALNAKEWEEIRKHPLISAKQILMLNASNDLKSKIFLAPFEHHIKNDMTGYPYTNAKQEVSLFGKILHIADVYDAMTSPRVYRPFAFSPDQTLSKMMQGAGSDYDPTLLKIFVRMMRAYPVGTLLELDTGEMGLVIDYSKASDDSHPRVLLLEKDGQGGVRGGEAVELSEKDPEMGTYLRNIVRSLNAASYGIQPIEFLFH